MREQYLHSPEEGVEFPRGTITGSRDPPGIDARDLVWVLCKSSKES